MSKEPATTDQQIRSAEDFQSVTEREQIKYEFRNNLLFRHLCGVADAGISRLESLLNVRLVPRGHAFLIQSESTQRTEFTRAYFDALVRKFRGSRLPDDFDLRFLYRQLQTDSQREDMNSDAPTKTENAPLREDSQEVVYTTVRGRSIHPRTPRQAAFVHSIRDNAITFGVGPAGTGKTFLSVAMACRMLFHGDMERVILTRPAVEAGESLGFLPGDLAQKVDPYLRPLYDALYECLGPEKVHDLMSARRIEIAPLAFMRGRTLNDSIVILDEAQNCTVAQLKMFLTRLGRNSRMCLSGDITQIDLLPGKSGLIRTVNLLRSLRGVGIIEFQNEDIVRNPMVEDIVRAFQKEAGEPMGADEDAPGEDFA